MMNFGKAIVTLIAAAVAACSRATVPDDTGRLDARVADATTDTVPLDSVATCSATPPPPNAQYCAMIGCSFRQVTLPRCDGAGDYDFYGPEFCTASASVVVFAAGWSVPCMMEASAIESRITQAYASRGVRVLTVYVQNPDGSPPTANHCVGWQNGTERPSSSPRGPLTSMMLMDPNGLTQIYSPWNAFPWNLVIDQHGIIVDEVSSQEIPLNVIIADLENILATEGR